MKNLFLIVVAFNLFLVGCGTGGKDKLIDGKEELKQDPQQENKRAAIAVLKKVEAYTEVGITPKEFSTRLLDINAELNAELETIDDLAFCDEAKDIMTVYSDSRSYWMEAISREASAANTEFFPEYRLKADYRGYPEVPEIYSTKLVNNLWVIAEKKLIALEAGPGSYTLGEKNEVDRAHLAKKQAAADKLAAENKKNKLEQALADGNFEAVLELEPTNAQALAMKTAAEIRKGLADGNYEAVLKLEPTNARALAMKNISQALANGDFEAALELEPTNAQALAMKTAAEIRKGLADGNYEAVLKLEPTNARALAMKTAKTAAEINRIKSNILTLEGARDIAFSPDGNSIAGNKRPSSRGVIWDAKTGKEKFRFSPSIRVNHLSYSPDGNRILSSNGRIFDSKTGKFNSKKNWENPSYSPDGKNILSLINGTIAIIDAKTGKEIQPPPSSELFLDAKYSPDGKNIVTVGVKKRDTNFLSREPRSEITIWDVKTNEPIKRIELDRLYFHLKTGSGLGIRGGIGSGSGLGGGPHIITHCVATYSPDGNTIVVGTESKELDGDNHKWRLTAFGGGLMNSNVDTDGNGSKLLTLEILDLKTGKKSIIESKWGALSRPAFSPDGSSIICLCGSDRLMIFDPKTGKTKLQGYFVKGVFKEWTKEVAKDVEDGKLNDSHDYILSVAYRPDGSGIAVGLQK